MLQNFPPNLCSPTKLTVWTFSRRAACGGGVRIHSTQHDVYWVAPSGSPSFAGYETDLLWKRLGEEGLQSTEPLNYYFDPCSLCRVL